MVIKLQLFAYKKASSAVKRDDIETLELKNDGSTPEPQTLIQSTNAVNTPTTYAANAGSTPKGVSEEDWNTLHSTFNESENTAALGNEKKSASENYKEIASNTNIIDQKTKDAMNATFAKPTSVVQAESYLDNQLAKIQSGRTSYTDQVEEMMSQIMNRDKFEYDVDSDQLFQQALASAMNSGRSAMQDTIGQASALTGGYGSTYATSAGNQAYNAFIEDAYNNLPEYYQMALNAYQMEGEEMYQQLGMLSDADTREYSRMVDAYNATSQYRNQAYNEAYTLYQDSITNAYNSANLQLNENAQLVNNAYNIYNVASNEYENAYAKEYDKWNASVQQAATNASFANSDWWNQTNFDYQKERDAVADSRWQQEFAETQRVNNAQIAKMYSSASSGSGGDEGESNFSLSDTEISKCQEIIKNGGTRDDVLEYLAAKDNLPQNDEDDSILDNILGIDGGSNEGNKTSNVSGTINGFRTTKGDNFDVIVNGTNYQVENKGKVEDDTTIQKLNQVSGANGSVFTHNGEAYVKYAGGYYKLGATNVLLWETSGYQNLLKAMQ